MGEELGMSSNVQCVNEAAGLLGSRKTSYSVHSLSAMQLIVFPFTFGVMLFGKEALGCV